MSGGGGSWAPAGAAAPRARDLIADHVAALACEDDSRLAHVPALYCPEVVSAIQDRGITCLPYDFGWPVDGAWVNGASLAARAGGVLLWFHPFGYRHPIPGKLATPPRILVDACHALRTAAFDGRLFQRASAAVLSPRKEFGLNLPGIAFDPRCAHDSLAWRDRLPFRLKRMCASGRAATRAAAGVVSGYIPPPGARDILTHLPLRSHRRDEAIECLRAAGISAWHWLESWTAQRDVMPRADKLRDELLLIPLSTDADKLAHDLGVVRGYSSLFENTTKDLSDTK